MDTKIIETELVKANITDQMIGKIREDYMPLKVKDIYDKVGFEAVTTARKDVKKFRVQVEKVLKAIRQPATDFQKAVIAKEKEIVARIEEVEDYLTSQEDIYNRKEAEIVAPLTDTEKLVAFIKAIASVKVPEMETEEGKKTLEQITSLLTTLVNLVK